MFDHVEIAASDLAASERFYRTILSVLGVAALRPIASGPLTGEGEAGAPR